jgi:DmsE family decaheme c-type cytochrome
MVVHKSLEEGLMCRKSQRSEGKKYPLIECLTLKTPALVFLMSFLIYLLVFPAFAAEEKKSAKTADGVSCEDCHEKESLTIGKTIHWKKAIKDSPVQQKGCIACHGSGTAHVSEQGGTTKDLVTFSKKETAQQKSAACLKCHEGSRHLTFWDSGKHKQNDVSCADCHTSHAGTPGKSLVKKQPELCITCHKGVRVQLNKPSHHPVEEGKVKCTDCHSPHGATGPNMIREASGPDLCYKCHTEKRGPFAFEHAPVAENCSTCHRVHGSNHENLLNVKSPRLCQSCHLASGHMNRPYSFQNRFEGAATSKNRFVGQGCLNCHGDIHGSNRSPFFVR